MKATEEVSVVFNSNLLLMGRGAGVGGGPGEKSLQVVLSEFGVVFLSCLFSIILFLVSAIFSFSLKTLRSIHTLSFRTHKVISFHVNTGLIC